MLYTHCHTEDHYIFFPDMSPITITKWHTLLDWYDIGSVKCYNIYIESLLYLDPILKMYSTVYESLSCAQQDAQDNIPHIVMRVWLCYASLKVAYRNGHEQSNDLYDSSVIEIVSI